MFGVPTFSIATKYLESVLMPNFLFVVQGDWEMMIKKMEYLERHPLFYQKLSIEIKLRAKELFIDSQFSVDDLIESTKQLLGDLMQ